MTYLVSDDLPAVPAGERFRALLASPGILQMPGAHNGMAALQAKAAGFAALYLSGAAMTASICNHHWIKLVKEATVHQQPLVAEHLSVKR